jgi:hypothetical protein
MAEDAQDHLKIKRFDKGSGGRTVEIVFLGPVLAHFCADPAPKLAATINWGVAGDPPQDHGRQFSGPGRTKAQPSTDSAGHHAVKN